AHEPALPMHDDVEGGPVGVRSVESPAGDRDVDKAWIRLEERCRGKPQVVHRPGPEVLDDDVGPVGEPAEDRAALFAFEVDREASFVAIESREVPAFAGGVRLEKPREVAGRRMLDLDDIGAEVRELHPAVRTRHVVPDLDDTDARKGWGAYHVPQLSIRSPLFLHTPASVPS